MFINHQQAVIFKVNRAVIVCEFEFADIFIISSCLHNIRTKICGILQHFRLLKDIVVMSADYKVVKILSKIFNLLRIYTPLNVLSGNASALTGYLRFFFLSLIYSCQLFWLSEIRHTPILHPEAGFSESPPLRV